MNGWNKLAGMAALASLVIVSACGSGEQGSGSKDAQNPAPPKAAAEPVELVFFHAGGDWNQEGYFMKEYGDAIKAKFPHVTPKFVSTTSGSLEKLVAAGQPLDIIVSSVGTAFTSVFPAGLQTDLDPYVKKHQFDLNRFEPTSIDMMRQMGEGKLFGLPLYTAPAPIYYNKDIFDKFGVAYPKDGLTWDELYEIAKKLTRKEGGQLYHGLAISPSHYLMRHQTSLKLVDPSTFKVTLTTDQTKLAMENLLRFYQLPGYEPNATKLGVSGQRQLFQKDHTAAMWLPFSTMHTAEELAGMNWDVAAVPTWKDMPGVGAQVYPYHLYLASSGKHKDQSFEIIQYLLSDEFQLGKSKQALFVSLLKSDAIRSAFGQDAPMYKGKNIKAMLPGKPASPSPQSKYYSASTSRMATTVVQDVVLKAKDLNTALREAEETIVKQIEADKNK
ncbi:extracellular solute-binding protein [Paenibacillus hemerocallicola]|uniref:Extracellular solute-binding protein n=1 Tax=Paenibacillus hemerocallicola TaxID=1172614 RepID=A0A5C4SYQ6_9BACL|nr:extracellular solute-binding protein [Paenibacillus hemerocallicola]TNJ61891.1 extracellular solute-binding protein [Paenibacillus hemerocallicola]